MQSSIVRLHNFVPTCNMNRCICTTGIQYNQIRQGRFLNKMLHGNKRKKLFYDTPSRPPSLKGEKYVPQHKNRRTEVLNKLFMKHITDLMATGEVAPQLVGRGIDISQVSVTNDFQFVNVYWHSRFDTSFNESTEEVLRKCGGQLQHELSQLRVIGIVPPIKFVQDKRLFMLNEIDKRLSAINCGEDLVSFNKIHKESETVIFTTLSPETKDEILKLNVTNPSGENDCDVDLPDMRHDVLGLNCSIILKKIQASVEKTNILRLKQSTSTSESQFPENFKVEQFISNNERRALFNSFLKQQEIKTKSRIKSRYDNVRNSEISEDNDDEDDVDDDYGYDDDDDDDHDDDSYNLAQNNEDYVVENEDLDNCK